MAEKYQVKLSVLWESMEYGNDVESDGYYVVKGTNEIIAYGEDLSFDESVAEFIESNECLHLPNLTTFENYAPEWCEDITLKYIDEKITDKKQKKLLRKAYYSIFRNLVLGIPGSSKFCRELGKLGRLEEWDQFVKDSYEADRLDYIKLWCRENDVEIIYDK